MKLTKAKILGSNYVGLFGIANDTLALVPTSTEERALKAIEEILDVKTIKTSIYESSLLAVFAKMNNKYAYLPSYCNAREVEGVEKEIKVKIIQTEKALGNMMEINDTNAIVSMGLPKKEVEAIKETGLEVLQMNIAKTDAVGSSIVLTSKSFLISPNASKEEIKRVGETLNIKGGSSTANTGDAFVRNSVLANSKGAIVGENTTGFEMNRIDEALAGE